ncbi:DNA-binding CsgD family transcriptional regulator [Rhizobium aquaticum]|uniref:DNA-binding CsgD family transcriptional regulator n=1 Tax=Rhizobium aquaticum TaxID=1549636 RepID=A0ABV2J600_9HYPH
MIEYLRQGLEFDNVIVIIFVGTNTPQVAYSRVYGPDVFRYVDDQYLSGAYLLDPIYDHHLRRGQPGLFRLLDVAPDQFRSSRYYKWYYGRIGISDEISVFLPLTQGLTITISMGKDSSSGTIFSAKAEENFRKHEPVIFSLLKAHWAALGEPAAQIARATSVTQNLRAEMENHYKVVLSARQAEVAFLILQGHSTPSIGLQLGVSPQTVKVFRKQLYHRCGICSQAELFALMMPLLGLVNPASRAF